MLPRFYADKRMAPQVGLEPTTLRLTAECSAIELLRSVARRSGSRAYIDLAIISFRRHQRKLGTLNEGHRHGMLPQKAKAQGRALGQYAVAFN
jgi:hypothetical protein